MKKKRTKKLTTWLIAPRQPHTRRGVLPKQQEMLTRWNNVLARVR